MFRLPILAAAGAIPVAWGRGGGWRHGGGLGVNCLPEPSREGVAEKVWGSSWDGGRFIPPHPPHPSTDFGVAENRPGGFLQSGPEII